MPREVKIRRAPSRAVAAVLVALGVAATVVGAAESDPFDLMHDSTPAAARARCVTVLTQCRQQCGPLPEGNAAAMGPWQACLDRCDVSAAECQNAVQQDQP